MLSGHICVVFIGMVVNTNIVLKVRNANRIQRDCSGDRRRRRTMYRTLIYRVERCVFTIVMTNDGHTLDARKVH